MLELLSMRLFDRSVLYQPLPRRFLELFGSAGAIVGEMPILDLRAVIYIHMVAMKAPPDDVAQFGFGATTFATKPLVPALDERGVGLARHGSRKAPLLLC